MARQTFQIPGFNGVGVGALNAQSSLGVGNIIYDYLALSITKNGALVSLANLDTDVSEIRIVADGSVLRRFTPALLMAFLKSHSQYNALANAAATALCSAFIPFTDLSRPTVEGREAPALGTADVKQLVVQIDFKDPGGAPVYTAFGSASARIGAKSVRFFETWQIETLALVNGVANFNTLSTVDDYLGLIIASANPTRVRVTVDNNIVYDAYKLDAQSQLRAGPYGQVSDAAAFPVAFDASGQVTDALPMSVRDQNGKILQRVSTLNWEVTSTAAENIKALRRNLWLGN